MNLRMYNVQFGDCFLLEGETENLLVDFGSDTPCVLSNTANDIINCCDGKKLSVLFTHFHKDHINGFWETRLSNKINVSNIYIPDIFAMGRTSGKLTFLQLHILSDIFASVVLQNKPVQITLYSLLKSLANIRTNIYLLERGRTFAIAPQTYQVLWPSFNELHLHKKAEKAIIALLADIGFIKSKNTHQYMDEIQYDSIDLGSIDYFIKTLLDGYLALIQGEIQNSKFMDSIDNAFATMSKEVDQRCSNLSEKLINDLKTVINSMQNQENKMSIVFQDKAINKMSSLLMTGDITVPELKKIISNENIGYPNFKISKKYTVIKSPHHATNSHFTNLLPSCDTILASNGVPSSSHPKWGKISYQYGSFYGSHKGCKMLCTNARCELSELSGTESCENCDSCHTSWKDVLL